MFTFRSKLFIFLALSMSATVLTWKYTQLEKDLNKSIFWSQTGQGRSINHGSEGEKTGILTVGDQIISQGDLDFEYALHTLGVVEKSDLTPVPNLGGEADRELSKLKTELLGGIVERKVLYQYIIQDQAFAQTIVENQKECILVWKKALHAAIPLLHSEVNQERLKVRICEQSALNRYMEERIFASIKVSDAEVVEYYKNHQPDFSHPKMVVIRQIVLGAEGKAKRIRNKATRSNFAALAREHSITPESEKGGLIGPYKKGELPAVFDIAFRLRRGDISAIQKSTYGFHIIKVEKKQQKREVGLDDARAEIEKILYESKKDGVYRKWVEVALHSVHVETTRPSW